MIPDEVAATAVPRTRFITDQGALRNRRVYSHNLCVDPVPAVPASQAQMTSFQESTEFLLAGEL